MHTHRHMLIKLCMAWIVPACTFVLACLVLDVWYTTQAPTWPFLQRSELGPVEWANWMVDGRRQTVWKRIKAYRVKVLLWRGLHALEVCVRNAELDHTGRPMGRQFGPLKPQFIHTLAHSWFRKDECHLTVYGCYLSLNKESIKRFMPCKQQIHKQMWLEVDSFQQSHLCKLYIVRSS